MLRRGVRRVGQWGERICRCCILRLRLGLRCGLSRASRGLRLSSRGPKRHLRRCSEGRRRGSRRWTGFLVRDGVDEGRGVTDLDDSTHVITLIDEKLERIITLVAGFLSLWYDVVEDHVEPCTCNGSFYHRQRWKPWEENSLEEHVSFSLLWDLEIWVDIP